jgi:hypothetical protein
MFINLGLSIFCQVLIQSSELSKYLLFNENEAALTSLCRRLKIWMLETFCVCISLMHNEEHTEFKIWFQFSTCWFAWRSNCIAASQSAIALLNLWAGRLLTPLHSHLLPLNANQKLSADRPYVSRHARAAVTKVHLTMAKRIKNSVLGILNMPKQIQDQRIQNWQELLYSHYGYIRHSCSK